MKTLNLIFADIQDLFNVYTYLIINGIFLEVIHTILLIMNISVACFKCIELKSMLSYLNKFLSDSK